MELEIKLGRADKTYKPGDKVTGTVTVKGSAGPVSHTGLQLRATGVVRPQLDSRTANALDPTSSSRPIQLMETSIEMAPAGKIPPDVPLPFEFILAPLPGRSLTDTYKGVYVSVRFSVSATLLCTGFFAKALERDTEFCVECPSSELPAPAPVEFELSPASLENVKKGSMETIPKFSIKGKLKRTNCPLNAPFTGEITVVESATRIRSIELQLVRVETIVSGSQVAKESTEIQNLQVGDGNVCRNLAIRLYMVFPRVFTCPTIITDTFKVEFEVNIIVAFE